jgi:hypothetical protein
MVKNYFLKTLIALGLLVSFCSSAQNVLIIYDDSPTNTNTLSLKTALENDGLVVTISGVSESNWDGTNPSLTDFDAVIHLNGTTYATQMPVEGRNALVNFVQNLHKKYIGMEWNAYQITENQMLDMRDLILMDRTGGNTATHTLTSPENVRNNPILTGVDTTFSINAGFSTGGAHNFSSYPVNVLMKNGTDDCVMYRDWMGGSILYFNSAGNFNNLSPLSNSNLQKIMSNFIKLHVPAPPVTFISKTLIIHDNSATSTGTLSLKNYLESREIETAISTVSESSWDGTNPPLTDFDAVIHLNGLTWAAEMPIAGQNALVDFVQNSGKKYVGFEWNAYQLTLSQMTAMRDLILFDRTSGGDANIQLDVVSGQENHPVMADVSASFNINTGHNVGNIHTFAQNPSTILMKQGTNDAVAFRNFGNGYVLNFHNTGNYINDKTSLNELNIQKIIANFILTNFSNPNAVEKIENIKSDKLLLNNMSSNILYFNNNVQGKNITIYNSIGQILIETNLVNDNSLNISNLNNGIYFIKTEGFNPEKFVKN